jgi:OOP family OmpA-OmpF porin
MAEATYCGKPDAVVYRLSGPGTLDSLTGRYVASETGTAQVMAYSQKGKLMSTANVTVRAPAPPPPPPAAPRPAPAPAPAMPKYTFEMQMVHFRFDRSDLTQGAKDTLNAVATTLKSNAGVNVDVIGHTDWVGTNAYNMKLSQARAETVKKYLIEQGVAADRIAVKWRGEEEPAADNKTAAGRATNRRAEIKQNN